MSVGVAGKRKKRGLDDMIPNFIESDSKKKERTKNLAAVFLIFVSTYLVGIQCIVYPGVYFDAVYPDYLAAIGAFPGVDNFTQITRHVGLPLLGNFHHGTLTAAVQFLVLKCSGVANVYTLRLTNLFYIAVIISILFLFIRKISGRYLIPFVGAIACATAQNIIFFSRSQYYIMLPGVIFLLLSVCILLEGYLVYSQCSETRLLLAGILHGVSFYSYFIFLLLAPVSIAILLLHERRGQRLFRALLFSWGILLGSILYFFGYYDSLLVNILGFSSITKVCLYMGCLLMFAFLAVPAATVIVPRLRRVRKQVVRIYAVMIGLFLLAGILLAAGIVILMPEKLAFLSRMFQGLQGRGSGSVFTSFWGLLYNLLDCTNLQYAMFAERMQGFFVFVYPLSCLLITVAAGILFFIRKKELKNTVLWKALMHLYLYLFGFYLCSLPFASMMQPQHLVMLYFMMFMVMIIGLCMLCDLIDSRGIFALLLLAAVLCVNFYHDKILVENLEATGGRNRYSSAYNDFAYEAYEDEDKESKVYVFLEWGFYANFVYLTQNSCLAVRDADIDLEELQQKLDDGCTVVIAAREKETISELLAALSYQGSQEVEWHSKEGETAFVSVGLTL